MVRGRRGHDVRGGRTLPDPGFVSLIESVELEDDSTVGGFLWIVDFDPWGSKTPIRSRTTSVGQARFAIPDQLDSLRAAIHGSTKSTHWKLRARIGERVQWYEEPEEVGHGR